MSNPYLAAAALADTARVLRCRRCDVLWRGTTHDSCWCCGATGTPRGEIRLVRDDES